MIRFGHALPRMAARVRSVIIVVGAALAALLPACKDTPQRVTVAFVDLPRSTAHENAADASLSNYEVVLKTVVSEKGRLVVDTIDANPVAHARPLVDVSFALRPGETALQRQLRLCPQLDDARRAVEELLARPRPEGPTNVFGAVTLTGQRMTQFPGQPTRAVYLSDMVSTMPERNLTAKSYDQAAIDELVEELRANGELPALGGAEIWVAGAALASDEGLPARKISEIRAVWDAVFASAGGVLAVWTDHLFSDDKTTAGVEELRCAQTTP
jgi:hypothetical protein